jgi:hypothetical protein
MRRAPGASRAMVGGIGKMAVWNRMYSQTIVVLTVALALAMPANAQTWQAQSTLQGGSSPDICAEYEPLTYTLELSEERISGTGRSGKLFSTPVPATGLIRHEFKSGWGADYEISGNVRTRELQLVHLDSGCRWTLLPAN